MPDDVIFRLSPAGGPPPEAEILFHAQRAQQYGHTWVGLPRRRQNNISYGTSRAYLITSEARRQKTVLRGIVRDVTSTKPDDELLDDIYVGHEFSWWWCLDSVECVATDFDALGLRKTDDTPYDTAWMSKRQPMNYLKSVSDWPTDVVDAADVANQVEAPGIATDLVAPPLTKEEQEFAIPNLPTTGPLASGTTVHAVDWSGGGDFDVANEKIRYARWEFTAAGSIVTVLPATLSRSDILQMIRAMPGFWILDFPFGLPVELLRRAGGVLNDLDATLAFTHNVPKNNFRNHCNAVWATVPHPHSKHRATERAAGGGWFAWFVQLFRQTWTGQVEILSALRQAGDPVAIMPWDHNHNVVTRLAEGFPRVSLRRRGFPAQGYKHPGNQAQTVRAVIVAGLVNCGLPLTAAVRAEAIADTTGDLIDALVMLLAGRDAIATDHGAIRAALDRGHLLGEGWIYP